MLVNLHEMPIKPSNGSTAENEWNGASSPHQLNAHRTQCGPAAPNSRYHSLYVVLIVFFLFYRYGYFVHNHSIPISQSDARGKPLMLRLFRTLSDFMRLQWFLTDFVRLSQNIQTSENSRSRNRCWSLILRLRKRLKKSLKSAKSVRVSQIPGKNLWSLIKSEKIRKISISVVCPLALMPAGNSFIIFILWCEMPSNKRQQRCWAMWPPMRPFKWAPITAFTLFFFLLLYHFLHEQKSIEIHCRWTEMLT